NVAKTADKIGVTTDALQEMRFAAELNGVAVNTADMALQRFVRRTAEAAEGTGEAKAVLEKMGIQLRTTDGRLRSADSLLADVADKLAAVEDQGERVRIAFKLFDSEGVQFVNVLQQGSAELDRMRREARELGIVIDEETLRSAEDLNDQLSIQQKIIDAELNKSLVRLGPALVAATKGFAGLAGAVGDAVDAFQDFDDVSRTGLQKRIERTERAIKNLEAAIDGAAGTFLVFPGQAERRLKTLQDRLDFLNAEQVRRDLIPAFEAVRPKIEAVRDIIGGIRLDRTFLQQLEQLPGKIGAVFGLGGETGAAPGETDAERREREREERRKQREAEREKARREAHQREVDRIVEQSEAFRAAQQGELETLRFRAQEEQEILREALQNKAIELEEFNAVRKRIEEDFFARVAELQADRERRETEWRNLQKQIAISNAAGILGVIGKHFKELHFLEMASSVSNTVMRTIESVQAALTVPPPTGWIFAAINAAAGAANIASIAATTFGSKGKKPSVPRGGGGGGRPARVTEQMPPSSDPGRPRGEMVIRVEGLPKNGLLPVETVRSLIDQINEAGDDGSLVRISG
ncbi:MAG: hypothetical protein ACLFV8_14695, partial [Alphaproteobacteria bacterium]